MPNMASRSRGRWGEARAAAHYRSLGFEIVDRNWRSPLRALPGELDLVLLRDDQIVFCEVKARRSSGYGGAAHAVDDGQAGAHQSARRSVAGRQSARATSTCAST